MTIHLSKELERFVREVVESGQYAREDDVVRDALERLKETLPHAGGASRTKPKHDTTFKPKLEAPLTLTELDQYMLSVGLLSQLPDPAEDVDDDVPADQPIALEGEPLSETILRERR